MLPRLAAGFRFLRTIEGGGILNHIVHRPLVLVSSAAMVHHVLTHYRGILPLHVRAEARLGIDLFIDSGGLLDLAGILEQRYGMPVKVQALGEAATVADLIRLVEHCRFPDTPNAEEDVHAKRKVSSGIAPGAGVREQA
jgi:acyl carrier protein